MATRKRPCEDTPDLGACTWTSWIGDKARPVTVWKPATRQALVDRINAQPDPSALSIRGSGAGHCTSEAAIPDKDAILVRVDAIAADPTEDGPYRAGLDTARYRRLPAGATIEQLNPILEADGLAFPNLGSYDAQTLAGAINTATHGSGLATGPLCDLVRSVELVTVRDVGGAARAVAYRVEPVGGPTDPGTTVVGGMTVLRDDDLFYSCVVGLGCFGIVTAYTLELTDRFWLREERELKKWEGELDATLPTDLAGQGPYYDLVLSPLPRWGEHRCLVTRRTPIPWRVGSTPRFDARHESLKARVDAAGGDVSKATRELAVLGSDNPRVASWCAVEQLEEEADDAPLEKTSYHMFRTSVGDLLEATSIEMAVPLSKAKAAIDAVIDHLGHLHDTDYHHLSPIGVRFQRASPHYLAPQHGRDTATFEAPLMLGTRRDKDEDTASPDVINYLLRAFEARLGVKALEGRPHWGQRNFISKKTAAKKYAKWHIWVAKRAWMDPHGVFSNSFTRRMGI